MHQDRAFTERVRSRGVRWIGSGHDLGMDSHVSTFIPASPPLRRALITQLCKIYHKGDLGSVRLSRVS